MSDPLQSIRQAFLLDHDTFKGIVNGFKAEYKSGLDTAEASGLATMIPSFVTSLPSGNEKGTFLSLDLGGSTLRICAVKLEGHGKVNVTEIKRHIPPNDPLRTSDVKTFFDWMVEAIQELLVKINHVTMKPLSMGICWSFPIDQTSISAGKILRMGKGFTIQGIEGHDLPTLFHEAFKRKSVNVKVTALVNDTVGTLVAHAYVNPKTRVGFIYGTGVNASYPEKVTRMVKLQKNPIRYAANTTMLVNTEIDIFGSDTYLPLNQYDRQLDALHSQHEFQLYEKMMSGAYLGELVRLVCLDLIQQNLLFNGHRPKEFNTFMEFETSIVSDIESHVSDAQETRLEQFKNIFSFENYGVTVQDMDRVTEICQLVSQRAARLAGAAMASLIEQQDDLMSGTEPIVIGVNGSTYEKYPRMHARIYESLVAWFGKEFSERIQLQIATDGGSIGGALIAMLSETSKTTLKPNNQPPPPPFLGCLFGWIVPFKTKKGSHQLKFTK